MGLKYYLRGLGVGIVVTALIMGVTTSVDSKETLSDDEIRERAKELGMVEESSVLADTFAQGSVNSPTVSPLTEMEGEKEEEEEVPRSPEKEEEADGGREEIAPEPSEEPKAAGQEKASGSSAAPRETEEAQPEATPAETPTPTPVPEATPEPTPTPEPVPTATPEATAEPVPTAASVAGEGITIQIVSGDSSFTVCKKLAQAGLVDSASEYDTYLCQNGYDKRIHAGTFEIPADADEEEIAGIILKLK